MVLPEFMQDLIPLLLALLVGVGIWSLLSLFSATNKSEQTDRLKKLSSKDAITEAESSDSKGGIFNMLLKTAKALASPMMPSTEGEQTEIRKELSAAGFVAKMQSQFFRACDSSLC